MRIAVLGLGFMGSTHLKAIKNIPGAELTAVVSDVPEKLTGDLSSIQGNLGGPGVKFDFADVRKYRDYRDALRDKDIEAVDICLPTHLHAPVALEALRAGKHVLVEKPIALTGAEADTLIAEARENDRILMAAQVLRFFPAYLPMIERVKYGVLGPVRSALFRRRCAAPTWSAWLTQPACSGGGVFDLLIHDVDMAVHLFGPPTAVSATGHEDLPKGIDVITAHLHYPNRDVVITGGWHHPKTYPFSMEFSVVCEGGTIDYSSLGRPTTLYRADGEEVLAQPEKDGYQAEIEYFIDCVAHRRQPRICPPEESALSVKLAVLLREARTRNGEIVPCSL
ncbi:MAG: Gfo/Idh/MocA family oxidoreductase [Bryobacteraceae bacterium]|nr:Gfo/Idh/MocA family oxidoreductase [Bryobacteraceae bacterium]